ncbi:putative SGNH hydrolase-type esterase domain-containing protein [Rosa chinensis]|uniref:Putative SGNH hydrolase-type esterase domain-containing protein n=1 Tax=Rosa chinensis TaxID=74649 RepID=A0A2P6RZA6_ROSCH|nr:putative SGNH hydrolase-type esterase domain-containing protein [Rosa chinensis]
MVACCGSGPYRGTFSCGGQRGTKKYDLCPNASEYVFFDSVHPTERVSCNLLRYSGVELPISLLLTVSKHYTNEINQVCVCVF